MGYRVRGIDNFSTGRRKNLKEFEGHPLFEFMEGDIRDYDFCLEACRDIDYVLHQAAFGSVPRSILMPQLYEEVNIKVLLGERAVIYGDGNQSRDFTYIENVIEANLKACLAPSEIAGEVFNIAYGGRYTVSEVYNILRGKLGKDIEPEFGKEREGGYKAQPSGYIQGQKDAGIQSRLEF
jgi:NAD dependent epimerase/dehydratase family.